MMHTSSTPAAGASEGIQPEKVRPIIYLLEMSSPEDWDKIWEKNLRDYCPEHPTLEDVDFVYFKGDLPALIEKFNAMGPDSKPLAIAAGRPFEGDPQPILLQEALGGPLIPGLDPDQKIEIDALCSRGAAALLIDICERRGFDLRFPRMLTFRSSDYMRLSADERRCFWESERVWVREREGSFLTPPDETAE